MVQALAAGATQDARDIVALCNVAGETEGAWVPRDEALEGIGANMGPAWNRMMYVRQ